MKRHDLFLYNNYSYLNQLFNILHNFMPPLLRRVIFWFSFDSLGRGVMIDYNTYFRYPGKIKIADGVEINRGAQFYPSYKSKDSVIEIHENVLIAPNVVFFGAGHKFPDLNHVSERIVIEKNSYIGGNSIIRYGVCIGENSIVAAGSVVISSIPPNSLAAGNPAKVIKSF